MSEFKFELGEIVSPVRSNGVFNVGTIVNRTQYLFGENRYTVIAKSESTIEEESNLTNNITFNFSGVIKGSDHS